jgi:type VI secretion system protein ImpL
MGKEDRAQVWGVSFPLADGNQVDQALAAFPAEFAQLEEQLQRRLLDRMQQERDVQRRALMYSFPQQFAYMGQALQQFLTEVFKSSRYEETALLRGVYFSSGTQEGSPIDRVMGAMAAAFGLERHVLPMNAASGRSYFITRLLREVIFPEAELVGVNLQLERNRRWLQWASTIGISVIALLFAAALVTSYLRNRELVSDVEQQVVDIDKQVAKIKPDASVLSTLPLLNAIRDLPNGYAAKDQGVPLLMTLGLSQGNKLGSGAQALYRKTLRATLLPRMAGRMEQQLRRGNANNPDYLYEVLRVYLMLGDARHFEAESIRAWADYDWERSLGEPSAAQRQDLSGHVKAMLETLHDSDTPWQIDAQLISDTRLALASMPLAQRLYNRIKREMGHLGLPEFSVAIAGGRDAPQVFVRKSGEPLTRGIPGMFSVAGFAKFEEQRAQSLSDLTKDSWVLARQEIASESGKSGQTAAALLQLYYNDYISQWDALLADVGIAPFSSLDAGARIANALSGAESPLRKFLMAAARETTLEGATTPKAKDTVADAVKGKIDAYKKKLESAMGAGADAGLLAEPKAINPVDVHFDDLHKLVIGPAGGAAPIEPILAMLKDVAAYLDMAAAAKRAGAPAPAGDALIKLKREADGKPAPLATMLKSIDSGGAGLTLGSERERLNSLWASAAAQFCRQAIAGRYPFVRSAEKEVTADDFGKFFAPGGLVDDFFQHNLMPYVDMGGRQWRWRANTDQASVGIPQDVLNQFQRAAEIRDAYFGSGGKQPSMRFELKLLSVDSALSKVTLDIDSQAVPYVSGVAARPVSIQLPSGKGGGQIRFDVTPTSPHSDLHTEGPWGWFRMIDRGVLETTAQGEQFKLSFDFDGRKLVYSLTASSVINPFHREALERFRCMDRL